MSDTLLVDALTLLDTLDYIKNGDLNLVKTDAGVQTQLGLASWRCVACNEFVATHAPDCIRERIRAAVVPVP